MPASRRGLTAAVRTRPRLSHDSTRATVERPPLRSSPGAPASSCCRGRASARRRRHARVPVPVPSRLEARASDSASWNRCGGSTKGSGSSITSESKSRIRANPRVVRALSFRLLLPLRVRSRSGSRLRRSKSVRNRFRDYFRVEFDATEKSRLRRRYFGRRRGLRDPAEQDDVRNVWLDPGNVGRA